MKGIEDDKTNGQDVCSRIGGINIKMSMLPKMICRFSVIPIKIASLFLTEIEKINLKIHMEPQKQK